MVDKKKLVTMTKLAIYDKNQAESDRKITSYFRNDYIYKTNVWSRISVVISVVPILLFLEIHKLIMGEIDILTLDYNAELLKIGWNLLVILVAYTAISTLVAVVRYNKAAKRAGNYFSLISKIKQQNKEDDGEDDGADIVYKRSGR